MRKFIAKVVLILEQFASFILVVAVVRTFLLPSSFFAVFGVVSGGEQPKQHNLNDATMAVRSNNNVSSPDILAYGVEIAFLFPDSMYHERPIRRRGREPPRFEKTKALQLLVQKLNHQGIPARFFEDEGVPSPDRWKLAMERTGFEVASPLSPPAAHVTTVLNTLQDFGARVHPELTMMHINVDARDRSLAQIGNVLKNCLAVEKALNEIVPQPNHAGAGEAKSMLAQFNDSLEAAYQSVDGANNYTQLFTMGKPDPQKRNKFNTNLNRVGLRLALEEDGGGLVGGETTTYSPRPTSFEFRGLEASTNAEVVLAWLQLSTSLVEVSYSGYVAPPVPRITVDKARTTLFDKLLAHSDRSDDDSKHQYLYDPSSLKDFFQVHRQQLKQSNYTKLTAALCQQLDTRRHGKYLDCPPSPSR